MAGIIWPSIDPVDALVLFALGAVGSAIYLLFIYIGIVSRDSKVFDFEAPNIKARWIMIIYISLGAFITFLYITNFEEKSTLFKILAVGIAWPGLILGVFSSKKAHESAAKENTIEGLNNKLNAIEGRRSGQLRERLPQQGAL